MCVAGSAGLDVTATEHRHQRTDENDVPEVLHEDEQQHSPCHVRLRHRAAMLSVPTSVRALTRRWAHVDSPWVMARVPATIGEPARGCDTTEVSVRAACVAIGSRSAGTGTHPYVGCCGQPGVRSGGPHVDRSLTFQTERIERFRSIGERLFAPAADPKCLDLPDCVAPQPDYAVGTAFHAWGAGGIDPGTSLHVMDATERVPGDVYLTGSDFVDVPRFLTSAAVWRSVGGAPFTKIFPRIDPVPQHRRARRQGVRRPGLGI
jgi:hypothetical protein